MASVNRFCTACGHPAPGTGTFCVKCGHQIEAPAVARPAPPVMAPPVMAPPAVTPVAVVGARSRALLVVAVVLALAVAVLAAVLVLGPGGDDSTVAQSARRGPGAPGGSNAPSDAASDADEKAAATQSASPLPEVACWDGSLAGSRQACAPVRGTSGLRWLFPSLDDRWAGCVPDRIYDGKIAARRCDVTVGSGVKARLVYSEWGTFARGQAHYRAKYGTEPERRGQLDVWVLGQIGNGYQTARMFADGLPYSVTIASRSPEALDEALRLLRVRGADEIAGYR